MNDEPVLLFLVRVWFCDTNFDHCNFLFSCRYLACEEDHISVALVLLEHGASTEIADKEGKKPMDIASKKTVIALSDHIAQM